MASLRKQIARVNAEMASRPERLQRHVERVVVEARELAAIFDCDPDRVELAARGHDLFRAHGPKELLDLARVAEIPITRQDAASPIMLHGPLAAVALRERFKVTDEEVLSAVRDHTTGAAEMPLISKIILLADKFEPRKRRRRPVMREIRILARRDLDLALLCWADWKWVEEREHGYEDYPPHWTARTRWVHDHHAEVALPGRTPGTVWPGTAKPPATES